MNYLSGALRFVAGTESEPQNIVPRFIDRIKTSALPHDRRSAIVQLTDVAKESPQKQAQVGEQSLKVIYAILEQDTDYDETVKATVELLIALCGTLEYPSALSNDQKPAVSRDQFERETKETAATNIDMYLGLPNSLLLLLQLLDRDDFYIKFGVVELLAAMAANSRQTLQAAVLEAPQGVARICDVLEDPQKHIRSNAVLLISTLCDQSPEICKIVVFGAVLEKLFGLIESVSSVPESIEATGTDNDGNEDNDDDDTVESAIIIQDSLIAVRTLVNGTPSTSTFFRDSGCVPRLVAVLQRSISDASLSQPDQNIASATAKSGIRSAIERQTRKNIVIAMQCLSGLVEGSDNAARLIKNDLAETDTLKILSSIAFYSASGPSTESSKVSNNLLQIRITALKTLSKLLRGHDDFRANFSSTQTAPGRPGMMNAQITTLRLMLSDPSSSIRFAAYSVLCDSFVVDTRLNLPSSALLNAMTNSTNTASYSLSENRNLSHGSLPSSTDISTVTDTVSYIVDAVKEALIGWPTNSDSAGVFYSASFTSWVLANAQNARERLLSTYANGSALLPQLVRFLGKLEREKGPGEVRIGLFALICIWLYKCPAAVSSFLSSAMHLPMLVDILKSETSSSDAADVHVRGLAAVLLGICFMVTENTSDPMDSNGFLGGGGAASVVMPKGVVADVIRSRIGVTLFTTCLDDLRATRAYSSQGSIWKTVDELITREEREGLLSSNGNLGHENWYNPFVTEVVDDVYKHIGVKAMDLVGQPKPNMIGNYPSKNADTNGFMSGSDHSATGNGALVDSTQEEVLQSYKEFIRSQDDSLSAARGQIEELAAALREAQVELDSKANVASSVTSSEAYTQLKLERDELNQQKEALEALLAEKTSDYEVALRTLAAFEEEQTSRVDESSNVDSAASQAEIQNLRSQNSAMTKALDSEMQRSMEYSRQAGILEDTLRRKDVEIRSLIAEVDSIKSNVNPDTVEALHWRSRAEIAESSLRNQEEATRRSQASENELKMSLRSTERARDDALTEAESLKRLADERKAEFDKLRATRERELDASRESSAANAAAQDEIDFLKAQLQEAQQKILEQERQLSSQPPSNEAGMERLQTDYNAVLRSSEVMKIELADCKEALSKWQKRAEVSEDVRDKQTVEINRLNSSCRDLEDTVKSLTASLGKQEQLATSSKMRVSELEQQCTEMEEVRRRTEDAFQELKKEAKVRTEQSIRLAGEVYEIEEQKAKLEEELESLRALSQPNRTSDQGQTEKEIGQGSEISFVESDMNHEVLALREELDAAKEELAKIRVKEQSERSQVDPNGDATYRAEAAENALSVSRSELLKLNDEMNEMKERLLLLDEAEHAKRRLTMQVVELQNKLEELDSSQTRYSESGDVGQLTSSKTEVAQLTTLLEEKTVQLEAVTSSLKTFDADLTASKRQISDLEKQIAENDAVLSVIRSERDNLTSEVHQLRGSLERLSVLEKDIENITQIKSQLEQSEHRCSELTEKLGLAIDEREENVSALQSVVDARTQEAQGLSESLKAAEIDLEELQKRLDALEQMLANEKTLVDEKKSELEACKSDLIESERKRIEEADGFGKQIEAHEVDTNLQREELERLKVEIEELKARCDEANTQRADLETQNIEILEELNKKCRKVEDTEADLAKVVTERTEMSQKLECTKRRITELDGDLEDKNMEIELLKAQLSESRRKEEEDAEIISSAAQKCNDLETAVANKTMEIELLKGEVSESEKIRDEKEHDFGASQEKCREYENLIEARTLEIELLKADKAEAEKKQNEFRTTADSVEQKLKDMESAVETKSMEMELLKAELNESEKRCSEIANNFSFVEAKCKEHESIIEGKDGEIEKLRDDVSEAEKKLEESSSKLTSLTIAHELAEIEGKVSTESNTQKIAALQTEISLLETECTKLKNDLSVAIGTNELQAKEWRGVTESQVLALSDLRGKLEFSAAELETLKKQLEQKEEESLLVEQLECQIGELEDQKKVMAAEIEAISSTSQFRETKVQELEAKLEGIKCLNAPAPEINVQNPSENLYSDNGTVHQDVRYVHQEVSKDVENVVQAIILDASCSATVKSLSIQLEEAKQQLETTRLSLNDRTLRADQLAERIKQMETTNPEQDEQANLRIISDERDQLKSNLEAMSSELEAACKQRDSAFKELKEINSNASRRYSSPNQPHQQQRIKELEDALRDAARTVAATNKELIAAQGLLVEISSDKTAMRMQLSNAEKQIQHLSSQARPKCNSRSTTSSEGQTEISDLSDVSEAEAGALDDDDDYKDHQTVETELKTSQVQVFNLKTALSRTVNEADSASSLVSDIVEKVSTLEVMMRSSQQKEMGLAKQISDLKNSFEIERQKLREDIAEANLVNKTMSEKHVSEVESLSKQSENNSRLLNASITNLEAKILDLKEERQRLSSRIDDLLTQLDISKEDFEEEHKRSQRLQYERDEFESQSNELKSKLVLSDDMCQDLQARLHQAEERLKDTNHQHEREMSEKMHKWEVSEKEYEQEIDRVSNEMEEAERGKRSMESLLKSEQAQFDKQNADLNQQLRERDDLIKTWTERANKYAVQVDNLRREIEKQNKSHSEEMRDAAIVQRSLNTELKSVEAMRDRVQLALNNLESEIEVLKAELKEESDKRQLLEEENQDFVQSTEWLEQRCKVLEEEVKTLRMSKESLENLKLNLEFKLSEQSKTTGLLQNDIDGLRKELHDERDNCRLVKDEISSLSTKLEGKTMECETLMRDNGDLRDWVTDLEKQASELQTATSEFEEVEQSLQESLEAQRSSAEQVLKLNEDLRKERETIRLTELRARKAERECESTKESLASCEEKLSGVEARLAEIRESSLTKLSASEASVRIQAQRCAELETALAQSQRQVAELGHVSDEAFTIKSDLKQTREEVVRLKQRCEEAETRAEKLDDELRKCQDDMEHLKECAGAEGLRALEAEHNELLVYLADLELELTTLKENAGAEHES